MDERELDAWLAEHLLGWVLRRSRAANRKVGEVFWCSPEQADERQRSGRLWFLPPDEPITEIRFDGLPALSSSGYGMLLVIDALVARLDEQDIHIEHLAGTGWRISTCHTEDGWNGWAGDEALPMAVALAARAALEAGSGESDATPADRNEG